MMRHEIFFRYMSTGNILDAKEYASNLSEENIVQKLLLLGYYEQIHDNDSMTEKYLSAINNLIRQKKFTLSKVDELAFLSIQGVINFRAQNNFDISITSKNIKDLIAKLDEQERMESYFWQCNYYNLMSWHFMRNAEPEKALKHLKMARQLAEKADNTALTAIYYNDIGAVHLESGRLDLAEQSVQLSIKLASEHENFPLCCQYGNMSELYMIKGELDKAVTYGEEALSIVQEKCTVIAYACFREILGDIYLKQGDTEAGKKLFIDALKDRENLESHSRAAFDLFKLVIISIEEGNTEKRDYYYDRLVTLDNNINTNITNVRRKLALGTILKNKNRMRDKVRAQEIFREIVEADNINFWSKISAYLNLCDLLVYELQTSEEEEILDELNELITKIYSIAEENDAISLKLKIIGITANIRVIEGKFNEAIDLFDQSKTLAEEFGLKKTWDEINEKEMDFLEKIDEWKNLVENNSSLRDRVDKIKIKNYIASAIKLQGEAERFI